MTLTTLMLVGIAILFIVNLFPMLGGPAVATNRLSPGEIRGMALMHDQLPWTLNFEQQNDVVSYLNTAIPIGKEKANIDQEKLPFTTLVIYFFNAPDLVLNPLGYSDNELIFSIPEWNKTGYIKDVSVGDFKKLLTNAYDQ